jgi:hypothetical protein
MHTATREPQLISVGHSNSVSVILPSEYILFFQLSLRAPRKGNNGSHKSYGVKQDLGRTDINRIIKETVGKLISGNKKGEQ